MKLIDPGQRPEINQEIAGLLGSQLNAARNDLKLSITEVADKLLLSKQQVEGLETADLKSFYGSRLFAQAADKYAALLGLDETPSMILFDRQTAQTEISPESMIKEVSAIAGCAPTNLIQNPSSRKPLITAIVALCTIAIGGLFLYEPTRTIQVVPVQPSSTPQDPAKADLQPSISTPATQIISENAVKADQAKATPQGQITLSLNNSSWIQTVELNGTRREKIYHAGDTLDLDPAKLQALIIGNVKAVQVKGPNGDISMSAFATPGSQVARLIGPQIHQLAKPTKP